MLRLMADEDNGSTRGGNNNEETSLLDHTQVVNADHGRTDNIEEQVDGCNRSAAVPSDEDDYELSEGVLYMLNFVADGGGNHRNPSTRAHAARFDLHADDDNELSEDILYMLNFV
jgi:hypothetical protein